MSNEALRAYAVGTSVFLRGLLEIQEPRMEHRCRCGMQTRAKGENEMAGEPAVPTIAANSAVIHHVSLPVRDVGRSVAFYEDVLGLRRIERPNFSFEGAWFAIGPSQQLHLIKDTGSTFREGKGLTPLDIHFAIRVSSYRNALRHLVTKGYRKEGTPDATGANSMRVTPRADAGFPQIYIMDPDRNMIEINAEALDVSVSEIDSLLA